MIIKRDLIEDDYNLVMALKQGSQETLNDRFQCFWDERCGNGFHLSDMETYNVLRYYALRILKTYEFASLLDDIGKEFYWNRDNIISLETMNRLYLQAIHGIRMMFDDGKDS